MPLNIGDTAPDFTLFNTEKQAVNLASYHGKNVVILFFPLAFTSTCTAELCGVRDDISNYSKTDAEILAISVDSPFALGKFKEEQGLNFNLLSDFNKTVSEAYGSLYDSFVLDMKGVSKRSAFVVDREGVVRYVEVLEKASDVPNLDAVKELLITL
jgi:peroxiredoxin